ncbi:Transcriptional regulator [Enhygromyxa salina]|uniref:Transcriptional regulator n=1 Tax=Enhygromyxa salina TaxID=215803 RepID=A0A0C2D838_9BACT|nr:XRE family transcriptional regulator [Enhygromyxa salina]KIG17770.1 Transcriptional regulator [Enhygromyxa salina]
MVDPSSNIGPNIRRRRQALGLSLDALAQTSGVSSTMLSEVERGRKNPTVKLAYQIALSLGCSLTELLDNSEPASVSLVRASERRTLLDPDTEVVRHGLRPGLLDLEVAWYELPPGQSSGQIGPNRAGVVELITVLEGRAQVVLGGEVHTLEAGDSISYGPVSTTEYINPSDGPTRLFLIVDRTKAR